jgi:hypothetical protein
VHAQTQPGSLGKVDFHVPAEPGYSPLFACVEPGRAARPRNQSSGMLHRIALAEVPCREPITSSVKCWKTFSSSYLDHERSNDTYTEVFLTFNVSEGATQLKFMRDSREPIPTRDSTFRLQRMARVHQSSIPAVSWINHCTTTSQMHLHRSRACLKALNCVARSLDFSSISSAPKVLYVGIAVDFQNSEKS